MMKKIAVLSLLIILTACGNSPFLAREEAPAGSLAGKVESRAPESEADAVQIHSENDTSTPGDIEKQIIRTASIRMRVADYSLDREAILAAVASREAYVSNENEANQRYSIENRMEIRVPAERFDGLVSAIVEIGEYVQSKNITSQDVTEEYVDLQARLRAKKDVEERYRDILKQARTIPDILKVEHELGNMRAEIEAMEGRLRFLSHRVAHSTINLVFYQEKASQTPPGEDFFSQIGEAFSGGWAGLKMFILVVLYLWPMWLVLAVIIVLFRRLILRRRARRAAANKKAPAGMQ